MLNIIVAMTDERVIGNSGNLPWNIPEELKIFNDVTNNSVVIMGRKTWESIPIKNRPLKNRINIILSKKLKSDGNFFIYDNLEDALNFAKTFNKEIFFIGGREVYEKTLDISDNLFISIIKNNYSGDVFFPDFNTDDWNKEYEKNFSEFIFIKYKRRISNA